MENITIKGYDYNQCPEGASVSFEIKKDKRTKRVLKEIHILQKPSILEIGIGEGRYLQKIQFFRPDAVLFGVDISESAIKAGKASQLKGDFKVSDVENLPYEDNFFDVVVIADVLEHIPDPVKAIAEINRVLKPRGIFHFYGPCENQHFTIDWFLRKLGIMKNFTRLSFGHMQYFNHADIKIITSRYIDSSYTCSDHLLSQIIFFFILYIPKSILIKLNKDKQVLFRDSGIKKTKGSKIKVTRFIWDAFVSFSTSLLAELEAIILKHVTFTAKELHLQEKI